MPYSLRPATLADLPHLVRHRRMMWHDIGDFTQAQLKEADPHYANWLRDETAAGRLHGWLAIADDGAVAAGGVLWLQTIHPWPGTTNTVQPYLLSFYTDPGHRGNGLARRICEQAIAWSRAHGYPRVALHASPAGRPVYEKLGFAATPEMRLDLTASGAAARPSEC